MSVSKGSIILFLCLLVAPLGPWLALLLEYPLYVNAWDEETYLSWQATMGISQLLPSYKVALSLVAVAHKAGISPAFLNALLDLLVMALIVTAWRVWRNKLKIDSLDSWLLSIFSVYGVAIFNMANPVLQKIAPYNPSAWIVSSPESYSVYFRTPNPELTYIAIALSLIAFRYVPNLSVTGRLGALIAFNTVAAVCFYQFVLPVVFVTTSYLFICSLKWSASVKLVTMVSLIVAVQVALGWTLRLYWDYIGQASFYAAERLAVGEVAVGGVNLHVTISALTLAALIFIAFQIQGKNNRGILLRERTFQYSVLCFVMSVSASSAGAAGGMSFETKAWSAYAANPISIIGFCFLYISLKRVAQEYGYRAGIIISALVSVILVVPYYAKAIVVAVSYSMRSNSEGVGVMVAHNPLKTIPQNQYWGSVYTMIAAKQKAPLGSYQYEYPWYGSPEDIVISNCAGMNSINASSYQVVSTDTSFYDPEQLKVRLASAVAKRGGEERCDQSTNASESKYGVTIVAR